MELRGALFFYSFCSFLPTLSREEPKIVDFVRPALGLDKHYNFIKSIQSDNENLREKLSFEELSGIKNIQNVKSPSADKKDPIIERNEPTR